MRFFWLSTVKDLRRYRSDITGLALWFLLPMVIAGLIGLVFGRGQGAPHGLLLIADEDHGLAGAFLRESISRSSLAKMLAIEHVDRVAGRARIAHGDASALLIIPKGYDRAVMRDEPAQLTLITNPEQRFMPQVIRETATDMVDAASYLQQIAGPELRAFADMPDSRRSITGLAAGVSLAARGVSTYLEPPRIVLKTTAEGDTSAHRPSVAEMLFPGIVFLVILMMSSGLSVEIWKEPSAGALRRVAAAPVSLYEFLAGKLCATSGVLLVAILLTFAFARAFFHIPMRAVAPAVAWCGCAAMVVYCGLLLAQLTLAGERTSTTVSGMIMLPLAMLGGNFFPLQTMPESFARLGRMTPNGWMLVKLQAILGGPLPAAVLAREFAVLLAAGVVLFALAGRALARK